MKSIALFAFAAMATGVVGTASVRLGLSTEAPKCQGFFVAPMWAVVHLNCIKYTSAMPASAQPTIAQWSNNQQSNVRVHVGTDSYVDAQKATFWSDANSQLIENFTYPVASELSNLVFLRVAGTRNQPSSWLLRLDLPDPTTTTELLTTRLRLDGATQSVESKTDARFKTNPTVASNEVIVTTTIVAPTALYPSDWSPVAIVDSSVSRVAAFLSGTTSTSGTAVDVQATYFGAQPVANALRNMYLCGPNASTVVPGDTRITGTICCDPTSSYGAASCTCDSLVTRFGTLQLSTSMRNSGWCNEQSNTVCPLSAAGSGQMTVINYGLYSQSRSLLAQGVLTDSVKGTAPGVGSVQLWTASDVCVISVDSAGPDTTPSLSPSFVPGTVNISGRAKGPCGSTCGSAPASNGTVRGAGKWLCSIVNDPVQCPPLVPSPAPVVQAPVRSREASALVWRQGGSLNTSYASLVVSGCNDRRCCEVTLAAAACTVPLRNWTCDCMNSPYNCPSCALPSSNGSKKGLWGLLALLLLIPIILICLIACYMLSKRKRQARANETAYEVPGGDIIRSASASAPLYGTEDPYGVTPGHVDETMGDVHTEAYQPDPMQA